MRKIAGGMERSFEKPMGGAHRGLPTILASRLGGGGEPSCPYPRYHPHHRYHGSLPSVKA